MTSKTTTSSSLGVLNSDQILEIEDQANAVAERMNSMANQPKGGIGQRKSKSLSELVKPPIMSLSGSVKPKNTIKPKKTKSRSSQRTRSSAVSSQNLLRDTEVQLAKLKVDNELLIRKQEIEERKMTLEWKHRELESREKILESDMGIQKTECELRILQKYACEPILEEDCGESLNLGFEQETFEQKFNRMYEEKGADISKFPGVILLQNPEIEKPIKPENEKPIIDPNRELPNMNKVTPEFNKNSKNDGNDEKDKIDDKDNFKPIDEDICEKSEIDVNLGNGASGLNPDVNHFIPQNQNFVENPGFGYNNQFGELLLKLSRHDAPECDLEPFDGNPLNFHLFEKQFEDLIESKVLDEAGRLNRLIKFTTGMVKELVKTYLYDDKNCAYTNAKAMIAQEYGNAYVIALAYEKEIKNLVVITREDGTLIRKLYLFLQRMKICCDRNSDINAELNTQDNIRNLVQKLPYSLQERWNRIATVEFQNTSRGPKLDKFVNFVKNESNVANNPSFSKSVMRPNFDGTKPKRSFQQNNSNVQTRYTPPRRNQGGSGQTVVSTQITNKACEYCGMTNHKLFSCFKFSNMNFDDKQNYLKEKHLCFGCLKPSSSEHYGRICTNKLTCKKCSKLHPTCMCRNTSVLVKEEPAHKIGTENKSDSKNQSEKLKSDAINIDGEQIAMNCVMVNLCSDKNPEQKITVYCFLDSLSNGSFIAENVRQKLEGDIGYTPRKISVTTMVGEINLDMIPVTGVTVESLDGQFRLKIPKLYSRENLPVDNDDIISHHLLEQWSHLKHLKSEIPDLDANVPIGLILGNNIPRALEPHEFIKGVNNSPYAIKSMFGWTICGPIGKTAPFAGHVKMNSVHIKPVIKSNASAIIYPKDRDFSNENIGKMFEDMYKRDFIEDFVNKNPKSQEDYRFMEIADEGIKLADDGHYEIPMPLREEKPIMPDNREQAYTAAKSIQRKLLKSGNEQLKFNFIKFMNKMMDNKHSRLTPSDQLELGPGDRLYLIYRNVDHPQKPDKFILVFDCSRKFNGESLNSHLIAGPTSDLTNTCIGVLLRFQEEEFAFVGDISGMFYQTRVPEKQRTYLRFFWWTNEELLGEPEEFQMCSHLFGASSSPSCAAYCLRKTALDNVENYPDEVISTVFKNFYVDDVLKSVPDKQQAAKLVHDLQELCSKGGFHLAKFVANDPDILKLIPEEDKVKSSDQSHVISDKSLSENDCENVTVERALGVEWNINNDTLGFRIQFKTRPSTRRGLLSSLSSIWDVLGTACPFLLKGKRILQTLCRSQYGWDDLLPDDIIHDWQNWIQSLSNLENIKLRRSYKPPNFGLVKTVQLHVFCDASDIGYGIGIYIRLVNDRNEVAVSLVFGKSRVIPLDGETIPRSELVAATIAAEIGKMVFSELEYKNIEMYYWTDSLIVLGYLRNQTKRFKTFVSNRVRKIKLCSDISQWRHIDGKENPADDASRGLDASKVTESHRWFKGPEFLHQLQIDILPNEYCTEIPNVNDDDPEIKKSQNCNATKIEIEDKVKVNPTLELLYKFSDWAKLKSVVASIQRMMYNPKKSVKIKVEHLQLAEITILKCLQQQHFDKEIKELKSKNYVSASSILVKFDPYLDDDGLIRVGGRLQNSDLDDNLKNPIILPKFDPITDSIVRHCHDTVEHGGRHLTLNEIRNRGLWIIQANSKVRYVLRKCVKCKHMRGNFGGQKMASLPEDRVKQSPPFTYVGVDMFGPFVVRRKRTDLKMYGALFTCLSSRAVHIETCSEIDTDHFILALRNFINRRGHIRILRSDNGSNFVGASNELKKAFNEIEFEKVRKFLLQHNCDLELGFEWKKNTPTASAHGGVWERMIRSVRQILNSILLNHAHLLSPESLNSMFIEVEGILNSRPLTVDMSDVDNPVPISPINLLTQKTKIILPPPGDFIDDGNLYCRRQWRRVQHIVEKFWSRYRKEYLSLLQERTKWNQNQRNFEIGDCVLLKDDSVCRNDWSLARIVEVYPDTKGLVRSVKLKIGRKDLNQKPSYLERPITKIVLLLESEVKSD